MDYEEYYKKFSKNTLPTPFWDKERETFEWVYYEDGRPVVSENLCYTFEHITSAGFYYSYSCRHLTSRLVDNKYVYEVEDGHLHAHLFEEVVRDLYSYPEHFRISKEEEKYYSEQELKFLKRVRKYLLFIGVKDDLSPRRSMKRYRNPLQKKYKDIYVRSLPNEYIEKIINGEVNYIIQHYNEEYSKEENFKPKEYRNLLCDFDYDIRLLVEYKKSRIKEYKEVKELYKNEEMKDTDKVLVVYFDIKEIYDKNTNDVW